MSQDLIQSSSNPNPPVRWLRTSRRNPCPICARTGFCEVTDDNRTAHCMTVPSSVVMHHRLGGWLHELIPAEVVTIADFQASLARKAQKSPDTDGTPHLQIKPLSPELIDQVNRALLKLCPLTEAHRNYLTTARANPLGCGSLDYSQSAIIARQLVERFGQEVAQHHPALLKVERGNGRNYWAIAGAATGILFPATKTSGLTDSQRS